MAAAATAEKKAYSITDYSAVADYSEGDARRIMVRDLQRESYFQQRFGAGHTMKSFDTQTYPFRQIITDLLFDKGLLPESMRGKPPPLEELHKHLSEEQQALDPSGVSFTASQFYDVNDRFYETYDRFLRNRIKQELFDGEDLLFQKNVTIRFYFPHAKGFDWKPSYHTDIMLGHPPQEINVWFPLTKAFDSNTMRVMPLEESIELYREYDFNFPDIARDVQESDALQQRLKDASFNVTGGFGDMFLFDSRCFHTLQENKTDSTRVSIDIRVVPLPEYEALEHTYIGTGRRKMPFTRGEYYNENTV